MKKNTKTLLSLVLAIMTAFAFTACGDKTEQSNSEPEVITHELSGEVLDVEDEVMTIETENGDKLKFDYRDAYVDDTGGYGEGMGFDYGQIATISYEGEIVGTDTSKCKVDHIVIQEGKEKTINGKLTKLNDDKSSITINTGEKDLDFDIKYAERHYKDGIQLGNELVINYLGVIDGTDTSKLRVTCVTDNDMNKQKQKDEVKVTAVDETVWTLGAVNVREGSTTASDVVVTLEKGTKLTRTGVLSDGWSRIEYKGKDRYIITSALSTKNPEKKQEKTTATTETTKAPEPTTKATEPTTSPTQPTEPPQPTTEPTTEQHNVVESPVDGIITDFVVDEDSTTVTVKCDKDTYVFDATDAVIHILDGETIGAEVLVVFEGEITDGDTSDVKVISIESKIED